MKPNKTTFLRNTSMFALVLGAAAIFSGCQKDTSVDSLSEDETVSAERWRGGSYGNKSPQVRPGADATYSTPVTTHQLDGSRSYDPDGTIEKYQWVKEFGPDCVITSPNTAKSSVTGMTAGIYKFKLTVTDNKGASASDTVRITNGSGSTTPPPSGTNQAPSVDAGSNQTITLPTSSVTLNGNATDADGIASYQWTKVSGSGGTISSATSKTTTVTGLTAGSYVFRLKATDSKGLSATDDVTVTVNSSTTTTPPPSTSGYTLIYSSGYNTNADLDPFGHGQYGNGSITTSVYKTGPGSFKSVPADVSSGIRSEVQYGSGQTPTEGAIEWDVMYEKIFSSNGHSFQFHPNTGGGSASPGLYHSSGKFLWNNWKSGSNTAHPTGVTIQANKWYHMRIEFKFGSSGYFRHFIDGVQVCSWTGQVGDGSGQYLKVGVNMWSQSASNSLAYYDNLQVFKKS